MEKVDSPEDGAGDLPLCSDAFVSRVKPGKSQTARSALFKRNTEKEEKRKEEERGREREREKKIKTVHECIVPRLSCNSCA